MINSRSKVLSAAHFVLALSLLFVSLYCFASALTYDRRQSFAPPTLEYDAIENQYLVMNMKIPLLLSFTAIFGLGWWCEGLSEGLFLKNNRKMAFAIFFTPIMIQFVFFVGMTLLPMGFINRVLAAYGFIILSGFYMRYSMISSETRAKFSRSK